MPLEAQVSSVAHVIQLSVAPVFLVSGVAGLLAVLTNRLGRIVDRARKLEAMLASAGKDERGPIRRDLAIHGRRARLVYWAISLCTTCALLICAVIASLFVGAFLRTDFADLVVLLFVAAILALIGGLVAFLMEIHTGIAALRIGPGEDGEAVVRE